MKNLVVERDISALLGLADEEGVVACCLHPSEPYLYAATSLGNVICLTVDKPQVEWRQCVLPGGPSSASSQIVTSFTFSLELEALCIGLSSGELLLLNVSTRKLEEVGEIEGGIVALEWSPDGEVFAAISGVGNLLVMNQEWELLSEVPLQRDAPASSGDFADAQISWRGDGKFFASLHRLPAEEAAAGAPPKLVQRRIQVWDRTTCELHSTGETMDGLDAALAWQPNGRHLYAVQQAGAVPPPKPQGASLSASGRGEVVFVGGNANAMAAAAAAATRPDGDAGRAAAAAAAGAAKGGAARLAAAASATAPPLVAPRVALFERNGLAHGGFDTREPGMRVCSMHWSADSELLALVLAPQAGGSSSSWKLQVWHRSNWHWYLKHERQFARPGGAASAGGAPAPPAVLARWDEQHATRLHVLTAGGSYEQLAFLRDTCVSDRGTAVVVDGRDVLLTPLRHAVVPPPMCAVRARMPEAVVAAAVSPSTMCEDEQIVALLSSGRLAFLRSVEDDLWEETLEDQEDASLGDGSGALLPELPDQDMPPVGCGRRVRAACWLSPSRLLALAAPYPESDMEEAPGEVLLELEVSWQQHPAAAAGGAGSSGSVTLEEVGVVYTGGARVMRIVSQAVSGAVVQLADGEVRLYQAGSGRLLPAGKPACFPAPCPWMWPCPAGLPPQTSSSKPALGLSRSGALYWGSALVATEVTSAVVRAGGAGGPALLYTTRRSLCYTAYFSQLTAGGWEHKELIDAEAGRPRDDQDGLRAAMHLAMRPNAANSAARDIVVRAVEQGADLVTAPRDGVALVMQMPRGNLEGVAPRSLVLAAVALALQRREYARAWELATIHRVDLNLLVDYAWPALLHHAPEFISALPAGAPDVCDLLMALRPDSVVAPGGIYANIPVQPPKASPSGPRFGGAAGGGFGGNVSDIEEEEGEGQDASGSDADGPAAAAAAPAPGGGQQQGQEQQQQPAGRLSDEEVAEVAKTGKVNAVCHALRVAMQARGGTAWLTAIVTSYARTTPPQLESALACVRDAKEQQLAAAAAAPGGGAAADQQQPSSSSAPAAGATGGGAPRKAGATSAASTSVSGVAEGVLKHLLLSVDADALYRVALGMYELPLAFMVVVHAQKDPGEYLQELQGFAGIADPNLQRHAIDMHLRRYEPALRHLVAAGTEHFERAVSLARERGLMRLLLSLYEGDEQRRPRVLEVYGEVLEAGHKYEDAGLSFVAAGCLDKALRAYRAAGQWRQVMVLAARQGYDAAAMQRLAAELSEELASTAQLVASATVLLQYLGDVDNGVITLVRAREWREALRVSHQHCRPDLVTTVVAPGAADAAAGLLTESKEARERLGRYWQRLKDVRHKREAMDAALRAAEEEGDAGMTREDFADAASDVASALTGLSMYTDNTHTGMTVSGASSAAGGPGGSSRAPSTLGGRKAQRKGKKSSKKRSRVKQGSPEEEASLVEHILGLAPGVSQLEEAGQLCELLVMLGHAADARTLQQQLSAWIAAHQEAVDDIKANPPPNDKIPPTHTAAVVLRALLAEPPAALNPQQQQAAAAAAAALASGSTAWKWDILRLAS